MRRPLLAIAALAACATPVPSPPPVPAPDIETGGFVATLGTDTVHIERFEYAPGAMRGVVVTRVPTTRVATWGLTLDAAGLPQRYTVETRDSEMRLLRHNGASGSIAYGDTVVRQTLRNDSMQTHRIVAPRHTFPGPMLPYIGVSYLMYEAAFAAARTRAPTTPDTALWTLTMFAGQGAPTKTRAWLVGGDSAELSYFGVARSGYRFDENGRLMSADWTGTTYGYRLRRTAAADVEAIALRWGAADRAGKVFGALSPRDTVRATLGAANITLDYGRPSRRGRVIWGNVVPWDTVWRLGADMATHITTTADLLIGETPVPAGRYTLWMIPSMHAPQLVVSRAVNVFGTGYNPARDLARISMRRVGPIAGTERLTIVVDSAITVRWDEAAWSVPVRPKEISAPARPRP